MGQELQIPQTFKVPGLAGQSQAFAALNPQDDNLAEGIGQSYGVIGYKGKVWSLRHRGERHNFVRPDDGTPSGHIDVVILGQAHHKSKSFYKKYDPNTSDGDRPICSSIDGLVPDADVAAKQSETCALCPRNVWKTDPTTGRKGRECTDYKRLAVLVLPTQTKAMLGAPLMEPVFLRVPPASLNSLAILGETMANQGFHFSSYITRISFDPNEAHPKMDFRPLQPLTDQEAPIILEMRAEPTVGRITGGEITIGGPKEVNHSTPVQDITTLVPAPEEVVSPLKNSESAPLVTPYTQAIKPVETIQLTLAPSTQSATVSTGFGGATSLAAAREQSSLVSQPTPAQQSVADTGEPEASDADLDARLAKLLVK